MKQTTLVTRLALMLVMAGALVLAGCGGDDNGVRVETVEVPAEPIEVEVPAASEIEGVQQKAANAAAAAKMASDNAAMAVEAAMMATANLATMQTGSMSKMMAYEAKNAADMAKDAYDAAMKASDAAAAATTTEAATTAKDMAKAAQADAEMYAGMASESSDGTVKYAAMELMIDDTMKSVGETTIDASAPRSEVTSGSGDSAQKTITGLIEEPMTTGMATDGRVAVDANLSDEEKYVSPMVNAAERMDLKIGKDVDSADNMARLRIITAYADKQMVKVYSAFTTEHRSNKKGKIVVTADGGPVPEVADLSDDTNEELTLLPVGMFYAAEPRNDAGTLVPGSVSADSPAGDTVLAAAKPKQVYSFVNTEVDADPTVYVVLNLTTDTTDAADMITSTYTYLVVDVHEAVNQDGLGDTVDGTGDEMVYVTANLPVSKPYNHLHFGVWANLGDADKAGMQMVDGLGIGFVQSIGDGMTDADMPNAGTATYKGNWAATIQPAVGDIELKHGAAALTANLDKSTLEADLTGLAMLEGALTGSTFKGTKATVTDNMHGLNAGGDFTGEFSGGFYGPGAVEAGGIFDFSSEDDGAFTGAFGGKMMKDDM